MNQDCITNNFKKKERIEYEKKLENLQRIHENEIRTLHESLKNLQEVIEYVFLFFSSSYCCFQFLTII